MTADRQKNIGLLVLAFLGLTTIFFGFKTIPGRLLKPFNLLPAGSSGVNLSENSDAAEQAKILALKNQDTDRDKLSDYDEVYIYRTSPYIADSDSDDISDTDEIKNGTDPNCPEGQDCRLAVGNIASDNSASSGMAQNILPSAMPSLAGLSADMSPSDLRALLREGGFSESELKNIDDATLTRLWQDSLKQNPAANSNGSIENSTQPLPAKTPTAAELRQMLRDSGIDQKLLDKASDEELVKMYGDIVRGQ